MVNSCQSGVHPARNATEGSFAWASAGGQRHIASAFPVDFARACFSPSLDGWPCTHYRAHRLPRLLFSAGLLDLLMRLFAATPD